LILALGLARPALCCTRSRRWRCPIGCIPRPTWSPLSRPSRSREPGD